MAVVERTRALVCALTLTLPAVAAAQDAPLSPEDDPQQAIPSPFAPPAEDEEIIAPEPFTQQRGDLVLLESVARTDAPFVQVHVGGGIYDARLDIVLGRWSPSVVAGYRFGRFGVFGTVDFDQAFDFSQDTDRLDLLNVGVGGEVVGFLGHVRSSLTLGTSTLLSSTAIDDAGTTGWFIDLRPAALRWGIGEEAAIEFTPLTLDVAVPVVEGLPLILFAYMTHVGVEWSFQ